MTLFPCRLPVHRRPLYNVLTTPSVYSLVIQIVFGKFCLTLTWSGERNEILLKKFQLSTSSNLHITHISCFIFLLFHRAASIFFFLFFIRLELITNLSLSSSYEILSSFWYFFRKISFCPFLLNQYFHKYIRISSFFFALFEIFYFSLEALYRLKEFQPGNEFSQCFR